MVTRTKLFKALLLHVSSEQENLKGVYLKVSDDGETFSLCATDGTTGLIVRNLDSKISYITICNTALHEYSLILPENAVSGIMYIGKKYKVALFIPDNEQNFAYPAYPDVERVLIRGGKTENPLEKFPAFGFKQLERANKTFTLLCGKGAVTAYIPHRWTDDVHITEYDITDNIMLFVMPVRRSINE